MIKTSNPGRYTRQSFSGYVVDDVDVFREYTHRVAVRRSNIATKKLNKQTITPTYRLRRRRRLRAVRFIYRNVRDTLLSAVDLFWTDYSVR